MDVAKFKYLSNLMSYTGFCLNPKEILLIENSLIILKHEQKFEKIFFWGKILTTTSHDYYIAFGYKKDCLRDRRFFYSQDAIEWNLLQKPEQSVIKTTLMCNEMFQGDPGLVLDVKMPPKFIAEDDLIIQGHERVINKLKEEQRLACIVKLISDSAMLVPRGALYNPVNGIVTFNPTFTGLNRHEAIELKNYQIYREPVMKYNYNLLKRQNYNYSTDFLDTLDAIIPVNKSFSITWERDKEIVVLRLLHWLGATFLHEINEPWHMFSYMGDGKLNHDVLFMTSNM
uniref:Radial spoke head protein 9 homolog n=1 Tax=Culicoides sonorensis TaxID=179676 RepID=A0A336K7A2_CULSO